MWDVTDVTCTVIQKIVWSLAPINWHLFLTQKISWIRDRKQNNVSPFYVRQPQRRFWNVSIDNWTSNWLMNTTMLLNFNFWWLTIWLMNTTMLIIVVDNNIWTWFYFYFYNTITLVILNLKFDHPIFVWKSVLLRKTMLTLIGMSLNLV